MQYRIRRGSPPAKAEMTPMIDMTFQLIAFFMVVVNFSKADQNERIKLPLSELAKPPDAPLQTPITLQLTEEGTVILGPTEVTFAELGRELLREKQVLEARPGQSARSATIIIRADRAARAGEVQEVIKICQQTGFEKYALRARQQYATEGT